MYGSQIGGIIGGGILICVLAIFCGLLWKRPLHFGDYKQFFVKSKCLEYNFYLIVIIWRCIFISGIVVFNESDACGYYAITLSAFYMIILAILRPYSDNIRPIVNSVLLVIICIIYTIYRTVFVDEVESIMTYLPIILVSVLYGAVIFNLIYMLLYTKKKCSQNNHQIEKE